MYFESLTRGTGKYPLIKGMTSSWMVCLWFSSRVTTPAKKISNYYLVVITTSKTTKYSHYKSIIHTCCPTTNSPHCLINQNFIHKGALQASTNPFYCQMKMAHGTGTAEFTSFWRFYFSTCHNQCLIATTGEKRDTYITQNTTTVKKDDLNKWGTHLIITNVKGALIVSHTSHVNIFTDWSVWHSEHSLDGFWLCFLSILLSNLKLPEK